MGNRRVTAEECKAFLTQLSLEFYEIGKAAVNGHYEGDYFTHNTDPTFLIQSPITIRRLRAVIQHMNSQFSNGLRTRGYKYYIDKAGKVDAKGGAFMRAAPDSNTPQTDVTLIPSPELEPPTIVSKPKALEWVKQVLIRTRGKELPGNYNPLLIGELFWEQSSKWRMMAEDHVERVAHVCSRFLNALLREKCPKDVYTRLWSSRMEDALQRRSEDAFTEIGRIMEDIKSYPITYNHYYTDTIHKRRHEREQKSLSSCIENATQQVRLPGCQSDHTSAQVNATKAAQEYFEKIDPDMERHSCEEALDCLYSIYKVSTLCASPIDHLHSTMLSSLKKPLSTTLRHKLWSDTLCAALRRFFLQSW